VNRITSLIHDENAQDTNEEPSVPHLTCRSEVTSSPPGSVVPHL